MESSTIRAPQPEAHADLRRKPRQVSPGKIAPRTETEARESGSQNICEAKSFRSLLKVKVENMRTLFETIGSPEGDVDTRGPEGVIYRSS